MAEDMERGHKAAQGMEFSVTRMAASIFAARGFEAVFDRLVMKSDVMLKVQKSLTKESLAQVGFTNGHLAALTATVALTTNLFHKQRQFNQDLIEANSTFNHRNKLLKDTLITQTQAGISFDKVTEAARALVHYGMDAETSFEANLEIIAKMEQGLGVSASESARLASIVERQVKSSFDGVARTIAQIVEDTALAGDEAARLATNISTALGRLRPGLGAAGLPEVIKLVGRYEGALKEIGGAPGALTQLLTQLTTPEGIVGAGALGVNPEFLATSQGVQSVMERFSQYGEMLVGQSSGWERQMRLQALAQQFNLSADQANQLMLAIKRANEQQSGQISLNDRWKQQLNATNSGISRLTNSLLGAMQHGLLPVINFVGFLTNKLADMVEWLMKSKTVITVVGYALLGGVAVLSIQLWGLVRALAAVALSSTVAQAALSRQAVTQGVSTTYGLLNPASMGGMAGMIARPLMLFVRGITLLLSPLGLLVAAAVGTAAILSKIYSINKESRDEQKAAQRIIFTRTQALEEQRQAKFYQASRYGNAEDVMRAYAGLASDATMMFQHLTDPDERRNATVNWLNEKLAQSEMDLTKGLVTRSMYTPLENITMAEAEREDEMIALTSKMFKVNVDQKALAERDIQLKLEQQREVEEALFKNRMRVNPFPQIWDDLSNFGQ